MLTVLIIEDNPITSKEVEDKVKAVCKKLGIEFQIQQTLVKFLIANFDTWKSANYLKYAVEITEQWKPDVVILDMELNAPHDGLSFLEHFKNNCWFETIVHSAYSEIALVAQRYKCVVSAVEKSSGNGQFMLAMDKLTKVKQARELTSNSVDWLVMPNKKQNRYDKSRIEYIRIVNEALEISVKSNFNGQFYSSVEHDVTLEKLTELLPKNFVRTHRSSIINSHFADGLVKTLREGSKFKRDPMILTASNAYISISRDNYTQVIETITQYNKKFSIYANQNNHRLSNQYFL